jgi:PIN domain nuclease of toxin-antitoxin system
MKYLLDTNIFIWFIHGDSSLSNLYKGIIENIENEIFVSQVSLWEMAIKYSLGKLRLKKPFRSLVPGVIEENGFKILPITNDHLIKVVNLPFIHRDPFDRLIFAQSSVEKMKLCYTDIIFDEYLKLNSNI